LNWFGSSSSIGIQLSFDCFSFSFDNLIWLPFSEFRHLKKATKQNYFGVNQRGSFCLDMMHQQH
jgi:hypothetical protein